MKMEEIEKNIENANLSFMKKLSRSSLSAVIEEHLHQTNVHKDDFATKCGISRRRLDDILAKKANVTLDNLSAILKELKLEAWISRTWE